MGQQQLILLVLATVIVGLATVVGIRAFSENADKSNADAMLQDAIRIANDIQAARQKPAPLGGIASFDAATFSALGYAAPDGDYTNLNGTFTMTATASDVLITGNGGTATPEVDANGDPTGNQVFENQIMVRVCGLSDQDIFGQIMQVGETSTGAEEPACP
jgi:hypothetical protein